jgi:hypothetical protein
MLQKKGRGGEREKGRVGERESGRKGENDFFGCRRLQNVD